MKKILFLLFLIVCSSLVLAKQEPQIIIGTDAGIIILYPQWPNIKQNQHYYFYVHAYNETDGVTLTNETTNCHFHIHNISGEYVFDEEMIFNSTTNSYEYYMSPAGFTEVGIYSYIINCNHSNHYEGTVSGLFEVLIVLEELTTDKAIMYSSFLFGLILLFILSTIGSFVINGKNEVDILGNLVKVNFNKHIKSFLFFLSYFIMILIVFMATKISYYYLIDSIIYSLIYWIQIILWIGLIPAIFIYIGFTIMNILNDSKLNELKGRNLKPF